MKTRKCTWSAELWSAGNWYSCDGNYVGSNYVDIEKQWDDENPHNEDRWKRLSKSGIPKEFHGTYRARTARVDDEPEKPVKPMAGTQQVVHLSESAIVFSVIQDPQSPSDWPPGCVWSDTGENIRFLDPIARSTTLVSTHSKECGEAAAGTLREEKTQEWTLKKRGNVLTIGTQIVPDAVGTRWTTYTPTK